MAEEKPLEELIPEDILVRVGVAAFHDIRVLTPDEAKDASPDMTLVRVEHAGETRVAVRDLVEEESETRIVMLAEDARAMVESARAANPRADWRKVLADHLERAVMPFHSPAEHWRSVECNNPALGDYLRAVFFA